MRLLICRVGEHKFGIHITDIEQIIPLISLSKIPNLPESVIGVCEYNSNLVRVIDLSMLFENRPSAAMMDTRIILFLDKQESSQMCYVGLMAEHVVRTVDFSVYKEIQPQKSSNIRLKIIENIVTDGEITIQVLNKKSIIELAGY